MNRFICRKERHKFIKIELKNEQDRLQLAQVLVQY